MKKSLLLLAGLFAGSCCRAQIVYHDIIPDTTCSGTAGFYSLKPVPSDPELVIRYFPAPASIYAEQHGSCEMLYRDGFPAKLNLNEPIGASAGSWTPAALSLNSEGNGNWQTDATDKYLAFRFKNGGTDWYYGWLKMTIAAGAASFTVKEWAYQGQASQSILAGQKAGPTAIGNLNGQQQTGMVQEPGRIRFYGLADGKAYAVVITGIDGRSLLRATVTAVNNSVFFTGGSGMYMVLLQDAENEYRFKMFQTR